MSNELETTTTTKTYEEDIKKYTKIDNLDEDPVVDSARFLVPIAQHFKHWNTLKPSAAL